MAADNNEKDIVYYYATLFGWLKCISLFELIRYYRKKKGKENHTHIVELWVVGHVLLSFIAVIIANYFGTIKWIIYPLMIYGFLRNFEIIIYQINVLLFDQYRSERKNIPYKIADYRRMVILLFHNFVEIVFWFSVTYLFAIKFFIIENDIKNNFAQSIYISFVTMTTFGPPNFNIKESFGLYLVSIQSMIGLIMTLLTFARFISLLPNIEAKSTKSDDPS
ncbi:hypothetical protein [Paenibacillus kandeliae]|uniref:hypothetical protein n=1 Tax=Paenibacillus kandeliae TaxID=3231269 RepID=UPI00345B328F